MLTVFSQFVKAIEQFVKLAKKNKIIIWELPNNLRLLIKFKQLMGQNLWITITVKSHNDKFWPSF